MKIKNRSTPEFNSLGVGLFQRKTELQAMGYAFRCAGQGGTKADIIISDAFAKLLKESGK